MPRIRRSSSPPTSNPSPLQVVPDPPVGATVGELRTSQVQLLQALRARGILAPNATISRSPTQFDPLSFTPLNNEAYTYHGAAYTMLALRNGDPTIGMMANAAKVFVQIRFSAKVFLNRIQLYSGQFNGAFHLPQAISIYAGAVSTESGTPLYQGILQPVTALQTIELSSLSAFDVALDTYTLVFSNSTHGLISVAELLTFGQLA